MTKLWYVLHRYLKMIFKDSEYFCNLYLFFLKLNKREDEPDIQNNPPEK